MAETTTNDKKTRRGTGPIFRELGATGLKRHGEDVFEEPLRKLQAEIGRKIYQEMTDNDPMVGAVLSTIDMLARQADWRVEPPEGEDGNDEGVEFLESNMDDMSHSWGDLVSESLTMLSFGWSWGEVCYKLRQGEKPQPGLSSQYNDGRIGLRKIAFRAQSSLDGWDFDDDGGIRGMWQRPPPDYDRRYIPIEKSLLFRTVIRKNNPEGRSMLRNAYRPWFFKKRIEEYEAIRTERDATGIVVARVPPHMLRSDASTEDQTLLTELKKIVRNLKFNEQAGMVFPLEYNEDGNEIYKLEILNANVNRPQLTRPIIDGKNQDIAMSMLADVLLVGHEETGSYALASSKTTLFATALGTFLDGIADVLNRHLVPRLFRLNGLPTDNLPQFVHGDIESLDLEDLAKYIEALAGAGMPLFPTGTGELERYLLEQATLPTDEFSEEAVEDRKMQEEEESAMRLEMEEKRIEAQRNQQVPPGGIPKQEPTPPQA
jgi:hypothetical protein